MTSSQNSRSKAPKLPRITVSLEEFPEKIIGKLVGFEGQTKSEVIRNIVKVWIGANSDKIQNVYGIKFQDVRRELELIKEEKDITKIIKDLPKFFKRIKKITIERLAGQLDLNTETLVNLILNYGDNLEKEGLNLQIDGEFIVKD